jgi:hypothetical protein
MASSLFRPSLAGGGTGWRLVFFAAAAAARSRRTNDKWNYTDKEPAISLDIATKITTNDSIGVLTVTSA